MILLISRMITGEAGLYLGRIRRLAVLYAAMAVAAAATAGFLLAALFIFMAEHIGGVATALIFAFVSFVMLIVAYSLLLSARRPHPRRADDRLQRDIASIAGVAALTNAPLIFHSVRKRMSLMLVPTAAFAAWGLWRALKAFRSR